MKKQNILKAGLFLALAAQISWNTHQAHENKNNNMGQAVFASISKSNTAAHKNNEGVFLSDQVQNADSLEVRIGKETYSIDLQVQEGINNLCASESSTSLLNQLSSNTAQRNDINCGSTTLSEYIEANQTQQDKLRKDVFNKVELKNLPEDLARNLRERINTEANCDNCEVQSVSTRIYSQSAGVGSLTELRNQLAAVLASAAEETADERKEKEKEFKKFKRIAKRMQLCEAHTPEELEGVLDILDVDDLEMADVDSSLVSDVLNSDDIKKYRSNSKSRMECQKDRFTRLADSGYEEEAEEFFFKHMQSDLMDFVRSNPHQAQGILDDLGMVAGLGLDEWDAHFGLDSSYAALQMMNTELKYRDTLIDYADALRNPSLNPYQRQKAFYNLHKLRENYTSRIKLINSHEDKESAYYNDLTVLGQDLSDSIGFNLTTLYCDAGMQMGVMPDYRCTQTSGRTAKDVYTEMASVKFSDGVRGEFPIEFIDMISDSRQALVPQKYERYTYTNEGFTPSIVTDRYNINDFINNTATLPRLSDSQRNNIIRNRQRGQF